MESLPLCFGVTAVNRPLPVKLWVATGNRAVVGVKDVVSIICINHIEHRNRAVADSRSPLTEIAGQYHAPGLIHSIDIRQPGHLHGQKGIGIFTANNRTMVRFAKRHRLINEFPAPLHLQYLFPLRRRAIPSVITILQRVCRQVKRDAPDVCDVGLVNGVGPPKMFVVTDGGKWVPEETGPGEMQPFVAANMSLVKLSHAIPRLMWIHKQHRGTGFCLAAGDRPGVGTNRCPYSVVESRCRLLGNIPRINEIAGEGGAGRPDTGDRIKVGVTV